MAQSDASISAAPPSDITFRAYTPALAAAYAAGRSWSYPAPLYSTILKYHVSTYSDPDSAYGVVLDVGCGPGKVLHDLAGMFDCAIGVDPGPAMIEVARSTAGKTRSGADVRFELCEAEKIAGLEDMGKVDLITAAMAAHWFDMTRFWEQAAKVLKPGGTVALWVHSSLYCHPSTPNAAEVQNVLFKLERETLDPYHLPGNRVARGGYEDLKLPWTVSPSVPEFPKDLFRREEWDRDGVPTAQGPSAKFFGDHPEISIERLARGLDTSSSVTRWREAHPQLVGTDDDCVKAAMRELKKALGEKDSLIVGSTVVLLLFKKSID